MVQGGLRFIVASIINSMSWSGGISLGVEVDEWTCIVGGGLEEGIMELGGRQEPAASSQPQWDLRLAEIRAVGLPMCPLRFWRLDLLARNVMPESDIRCGCGTSA